jgi:hypothetical protein
MADYKYSVKNTTTAMRQELRDSALSYSILDASEPTNETMKLVDQYVEGIIEISDALEKTVERYRNLT